ncbi:MAG: B12-binding domain-containing radical SAM protein, partial [Chlorobiaceae bacterium]|nr:B12-binding domain-containing radical SAM protein [Chlorobiaceae bacterium]
EPKKIGTDTFLENFVKIQKEVYGARAIMRRMKGKPLNWVWLANLQMNRFTRALKPAMFL